MGVGQPASHLLMLFGAHVQQAFGHTPYHVGSSLIEKRGWRDVDVRLILPDDEYATLFGDLATPEHNAPKLSMHNLAWSIFGRELTGLPIDFQIQQQTNANEAEENDGPRGAMLFGPDDFTTGQWVVRGEA
jgi:hypothetical protein